MARRVFLHIGAPKTGTTFLQTIMWQNRPALRQQGYLYPGDSRMDHYQAAQDIRHAPRPDSTWESLVRAIEAWPDTGLITHEFFCMASSKHAERAVQRLAPAEVHVVFTARDLVRQFPAVWQEALKMGSELTFDDFMDRAVRFELDGPWSWRTQNIAAIVRRWSEAVEPGRFHVITVPRAGAPRDLLWRRWCQVVGIEPDSVNLELAFANESLGVQQSALLHRVNQHLSAELLAEKHLRHRWLRQYLGHEVLVPQGGPRFGVRPKHARRLDRISEKTIAAISEGGYDVVGDLDELRPDVPDTVPPNPGDTTDAELVDVAAQAIEQMVRDMRRMTNDRDEWRRRALAGQHGWTGRVSVLRHRARRLVRRVARRLGLR